ncbi:hypothetical protein Fmac_020403 [Flemingia macrophylla]|uniref:AP2/ERF domain-containing protein n=1 Tax=Flemingia macrophylla TaxID=520843 RepID=A0ABD1LU45_9FABA
MENVSDQGLMTNPDQTGEVASTIEDGVSEPVKRKRYRSLNEKKNSSKFRGVTMCRGRFESFVWDNDPKTTGKRGKSGGFKTEEEAAKAHDLIAIKMWGDYGFTNFPVENYEKQLSDWKDMDYRECIREIRQRIMSEKVKHSSMSTRSDDRKVSRKKGKKVSSSAKAQTTNDALSNKRDNKVCDPSTNSHNNNTLKQHNDRDGLEQHAFISPPIDGHQNPDGSINAHAGAATVEMEEYNVDGETFLDHSTIMQSMLEEVGQELNSPTTWQNLHGDVNESLFENQIIYGLDQDLGPDLAFQDDLSFQNGQNSPLWSFDYGSASSIEFHTLTLGNDNALNWEPSMSHVDNVNPIVPQNDSVGEFRVDSTGFQSLEPNSEQFEAPNQQAQQHQRYEPFQPGSDETKTSSPKNTVNNDLDISQYLDLNGADMEDTNWTKSMHQLWSNLEAKKGD